MARNHKLSARHVGLFSLWLSLVLVLMTGCGEPAENNAGSNTDPKSVANWTDEKWSEDTLQWRERRLARLTAIDGYLSLSGLDFFENGQWIVGLAESSDITMPAGPEIWGQLILANDDAWFVPATDEIQIQFPHPDQDGSPSMDAVRLTVSGSDDPPSRVGFGDTHFYLAVRKGDWAVRTRDPNSSARQGFVGLDYYDLNRDFQVVGQFEPHPLGTTIPTATVLGELLDEPNPGRVVFELAGQTYSLEAIESESGDQFFFILADRTSGSETYGLGRFLYADLPNAAGQVVLDFNRSYNPPCAFNAYTTCPLPPPQNRLDAYIRAGELKYRGVAGQDPDQLP